MNVNDIAKRLVASESGWVVEVELEEEKLLHFRLTYDMYVTGWSTDQLKFAIERKEQEAKRIIGDIDSRSTRDDGIGISSLSTGALQFWTKVQVVVNSDSTTQSVLEELNKHNLVSDVVLSSH